jgi:hypothetical protein
MHFGGSSHRSKSLRLCHTRVSVIIQPSNTSNHHIVTGVLPASLSFLSLASTYTYGVVGKERRVHTPQYCMTRSFTFECLFLLTPFHSHPTRDVLFANTLLWCVYISSNRSFNSSASGFARGDAIISSSMLHCMISDRSTVLQQRVGALPLPPSSPSISQIRRLIGGMGNIFSLYLYPAIRSRGA